MKLAALIPDRGDRPEFIQHCLKQVEKMGFDEVIHVNYKPVSADFDLKDRIYKGYKIAVEKKVDWVFIVENDDFYPSDYISKFRGYLDNCEFIGDETTIYYHLKSRVYKQMIHRRRSSLFTTAFKVSAMATFNWKDAKMVYFDIDIWKFASTKKKAFIHTGAVGIKHGKGLVGGNGHKMTTGKNDENMLWLKNHVSAESFEFYKLMSDFLNGKVDTIKY